MQDLIIGSGPKECNFKPEGLFQRMCHAAAAISPISFPNGPDARAARLLVAHMRLGLHRFGFGWIMQRGHHHSAGTGDTV
jgi:hypothetical protein